MIDWIERSRVLTGTVSVPEDRTLVVVACWLRAAVLPLAE